MTKSKLFFATLLALLFYVSPVSASDCGEKQDPCGKRTGWSKFETVRLRLHQAGMSVPVNWLMQSSRKNNDLQVDIEYADPKQPQRGTIMMVEGMTFVSKGIILTKGREIDQLDWPLLSILVTQKALGRALPDGPEKITGNRQIKFDDKKTGIQFATPSAEGFIPPPWSLIGLVEKNADGSVDFDLKLTWTQNEGKQIKRPTAFTLTGQFKHSNDFAIDSNMSLEGLDVFGVGAIVEKTASGTRIDYGAKPTQGKPRTVADIRKAIAAENYPGEADLSVNFAGFWKGSCSDGFGLRIKPVDIPGMYTVTFCGPGGCGDEGNERKTFIKGDKRYNVISATELQVGQEGSRSTYKKCSNNMLP
ncbi:MAG: hypothetical protein ING75_11195 [Rhodocyclaceae bacterium]|nr:hypothetical protein [Rhodocyclaceae bacterium]